METELGRVVQHQDQRAASSDAVAGGLKMSTQNLRLADARIGEKAIRRFGVRPILPRPRQASADSLRDLPTWREPERICALSRPAVVRRGGAAEPDFSVLSPLVSVDRLAEIRAAQIEMPLIITSAP